MVERLKGLVIAEGLDDPTIVKQLVVYRASIGPLGYGVQGTGSDRRHSYWVSCTESEVALVQAHTIPGWYAHFWDARRIVVVFHDRTFVLDKIDRTTWHEAVAHGVAQGIPAEQLDFLVD